MAFILTFLGKGGTGRTTVAIAAAKSFAQQGKRVLIASQDIGPALRSFLAVDTLGIEPTCLEPNIDAVQLQATHLLSDSWEEAKALEAQYVRTPFLKSVFGQELGLLPGMADALTLYWLKNMDASDRYDVIIMDGADSQSTLRMFGIPEIGSWYGRRFKKVFDQSDFAKTIMPLLQPIAAMVLSNGDGWGNHFSQPANQVDDLFEQGRQAIAHRRVAAYLVTTTDSAAIQSAQYLWGSAQQINLTVGGVLLTPSSNVGSMEGEFSPIPLHVLPQARLNHWDPLVSAMPDFRADIEAAPSSLTLDLVQRQVQLFLPGFTKQQVKLTQYGPELTIEAGDQRRNILLPPSLEGGRVKGAKFQDSRLTITL